MDQITLLYLSQSFFALTVELISYGIQTLRVINIPVSDSKEHLIQVDTATHQAVLH